MITVRHSYGADTDWLESFANSCGGKIEGNFINIPEEINTGTRYYLDCGDDFLIYYVDVVYNNDIHFIQSHNKKDFIGLYYNLIEGKTMKTSTDFSYDVSRFGYDLAVIDSILETNLHVTPGVKSCGISIFIKKNRIESFAKENKIFSEHIERLINSDKNTFIKFDRMSPESFYLINDLKKLKVGSEIFNLNLIAVTYQLFSNYMNQLFNNTIIIEKVNQTDLSNIISTQIFLLDNIEEAFPSIKAMAEKACMSETKFKKLFKKITGTTPNSFFLNNKLRKAKELLEEQNYTILETCDKLKFTNYSYFIFKFRDHFGISPKIFVKKL